MSNDQTSCKPDLLPALLDDALSAGDSQWLEGHLGGCAACRERLESLAAGPDLWRDVRQSLSDSALAISRSTDAESDVEPTGALVTEAGPCVIHERPAFLSATDDPHMLGRLGPYEVAGIVGSGGMGIVLKAFDPALHRYVAIKVLAPHLAMSGAARKRFAREAQAAAAVVHDNVIAIHSVAEANGYPYFVMPYMRGESLQRRLDREGPLAVIEILRIALQVASGLAAAHAQGLVHRDVKPGNILLEEGVDRVALTDFGLARAADDASLTRSGMIAGTPQFMSPEQARGEPVDARSDLFSLGSVLYAMGTGRPPFRAETSYGVLRRITDTEPGPIRDVNAEIPEWLERIVAGLLRKSPDERLGTAEDVAVLLRACLAHVQRPSNEPLPGLVMSLPGWMGTTPQERPVRNFPLRRVGWIAATLVLAVAVSLTRWIRLGDSPTSSKLEVQSQAGEVSPNDPARSDALPYIVSIPGVESDPQLLSIEQELQELDERISQLEEVVQSQYSLPAASGLMPSGTTPEKQ